MVRPINLGTSSAFSPTRPVFDRQNAFTAAFDTDGAAADLLTPTAPILSQPAIPGESASQTAVLALTAVAVLLQAVFSGGTSAGGSASTQALQPATAGAVDPQLEAKIDAAIVGGSPSERAELKQSLMAVAQDPDGRKLLENNLARGNTFAVGNPEQAINGQADAVVKCNCALHQVQADNSVQRDVLGVTLSQGANNPAQIIVGDANNIKTIVHEMVHGASTGDGNSLEEESTANIIGKRVAANLGVPIDGAGADDPVGTIRQTLPNYRSSGLNATNNIANTLAGLGINVGINVSQFV